VNYQQVALDEPCPECKVEPRIWCVHILWGSGQNQSQVGEPTRRLHNGRFNAAWQTELRKKRAAEVAMLREFFQRFSAIFEEGRL
jgi:hypothetical protein